MKQKSYFLLYFAFFFLIASCIKDEEILPIPESEFSEFEINAMDYFKEVALGFEDGGVPEITRKWRTSMKIFIDGNPSIENRAKIEETVLNINALSTDGFLIEIVEAFDDSNCHLFFGTAPAFEAKFPEAGRVGSNYGNFYVWWWNSYITRARIFIDTDRPNLEQQQSLILEEITQATGLGKDSPKYQNSIFYETSTDGGFAVEYSKLDQEVVRFLYHPKMRVGLNESQVDSILKDILRE